MNNKIIKIHCTDWNFIFYVTIENDQLRLSRTCAEKPATEINGTLANFLQVCRKGGTAAAAFQHPVEIIGDVSNVEQLRDIASSFDFEEYISQFLGDVAAHKSMRHVKNLQRCAKNVVENLKMQAQEYLHFEIKTLPTKKQVEQFYRDIAILRDDVERLAAKIS